MNLATDFIDILQGFIFKAGAATPNDTDGSAVPPTEGCVDGFNNSKSKCCCCFNMRDGSTSTHDLFSYIWHTEGEGMEPACGVIVDEDESNRSCTAASCCGRYKQCSVRKRAAGRNRCQAELQVGRCDASTSTFDLSAYMWGTIEGEVEVSEDYKGKSLDDEAVHLGNINGLRVPGAGTKRPLATRNSDCGRSEGVSPPCKKKRKWT